RGLGLISGRVRRIPDISPDGMVRKVPQIGWNSLEYPEQAAPGHLFQGISEGSHVYFVHSYACEASDRSIVKAVCTYGITVDASVEQGRLYACQFHPEKSADVGMQILKNFLRS
ncbi:MAG: imidazole glycerol phosphate synthase subunit HisH, partial [Butyrivibrio sp.]|nr:imidazole glycerol phosphate synthase subunit HisH [Butyrivibrio sp.]